MNEITAHLISVPPHVADAYFRGDDLFDLQEMLADDYDGPITFAKTEVPNTMLALADDVPVAIVVLRGPAGFRQTRLLGKV